MNTVPNNVDWSATAAWIALAISITGTILSPIITTILTNRYQLKLKKVDLKEQAIAERNRNILDCLSSIGMCLSTHDHFDEFGKKFHAVYPYVPESEWPLLDEFCSLINDLKIEVAQQKQYEIIHLLSGLLKEELQ